jgi:sensor histidine kinase YesM
MSIRYFTVSDTGVGVADKTTFGTGIGLTNTKLILEKMYNSTLKITDNFPRGLKLN